MAEATVQKVAPLAETQREANCTMCLTRDCAMAGRAEYPVRLCNSYRQANCYLCTQQDCVLKGALNSPVLMCDQFQPLAMG